MNAMIRKTNDRHIPAGRAVGFVCVALVLTMVWSFFPVTALAAFADTPLGSEVLLKMEKSATFAYKFSDYDGPGELPPEFGQVNHDINDQSDPSTYAIHNNDVNFYYTEDTAGGKRAVYCFEPDNPWVDYNRPDSIYNILPSIPDHSKKDEINQEQRDMLAYVMAMGVTEYIDTTNSDQVATQLAIWMVGAGHYKSVWLEKLLPSTGTDPGIAPNQAICDEAHRLLTAALSCVQDRPSFVNTGDLRMYWDGTTYTVTLTDTSGKLTNASEWGVAILAQFTTPDLAAVIDDVAHTLTITGDPGAAGKEISITLGGTGKKGNIVFLDSPFTTSLNDHFYFKSRQSMITINTLEPAVAGQFNLVRRDPKIATTATNEADGSQTIKPDQEVTLTDAVTYTDLNPGEEYALTCILMVNDGSASGTQLTVGGNPVTKTVNFTPIVTGDGSGTVEMTFKFNATGLGGKTLVVFEELLLNGNIIATHKDISDVDQSIKVAQETPAGGNDGYDYEPTPIPSPDPQPSPEPTEPPYVPGGTDPVMPPNPSVPGNMLIPDGDGWLELDENGVPLGSWAWDNEEDMWIFDEDIPLGNLPQTGDNGMGITTLLLLLGLSLLGIGVTLRSKKSYKSKGMK